MRCHRDELIWQCYECIKVSRSFVVVVHFFTKRRDIGHDRPLFPVYAKLIIDRKHFLPTTLKWSEVHLFLGKNSPFNQMISFFIFLVALINLKAKSSGKVTDIINRQTSDTVKRQMDCRLFSSLYQTVFFIKYVAIVSFWHFYSRLLFTCIFNYGICKYCFTVQLLGVHSISVIK